MRLANQEERGSRKVVNQKLRGFEEAVLGLGALEADGREGFHVLLLLRAPTSCRDLLQRR
jgi:hypothetical protein